MPRSRNIKPSLFKNEILGEADPLLTIVFIGLWTLADREGRLEDRPKRIKAEILPYRECPNFNGYLTELARLGFIHRYTVENRAYIQVINFSKHQAPHKTERASEIPEPTEESVGCESTVKAPLSNGSATVKESLIPDSSNTDSCTNPPNPPSGGNRRGHKWGESPEGVDPTAWVEFTDYKGGSPAKATVTKLANKLAAHPPEIQRRAVDDSIANGWKGVFPEKANEAHRSNRRTVEDKLANLRRLSGDEEGGEGLDEAAGNVRGQVLQGVWERTE